MPIGSDSRIRSDDDLEDLTPIEFFTSRFPALADANGHLVAAVIAQLHFRPLSIEADDGAWSTVAERSTIRALSGPLCDPRDISMMYTNFFTLADRTRRSAARSYDPPALRERVAGLSRRSKNSFAVVPFSGSPDTAASHRSG